MKPGAAVRTGRERTQSAYEPVGFPQNPFVTDIDRQLKELRTAAKEKDKPILEWSVVGDAAQTPGPEEHRSPGAPITSPFETADPPVEPTVAGANTPLPARGGEPQTRPVSSVRPVTRNVTTMADPEKAGQSDRTMIVDSDMLPPRLGAAGEPVSAADPKASGGTPRAAEEPPSATGRSATVLELEGPGESPWQSADRRPAEWISGPEIKQTPAIVEPPAPPPPAASELPPQLRLAQRDRSWSGSRAMKNVRWDDDPVESAKTGMSRPPVPILLAGLAGLLALAAWSRFRRRSAP